MQNASVFLAMPTRTAVSGDMRMSDVAPGGVQREGAEAEFSIDLPPGEAGHEVPLAVPIALPVPDMMAQARLAALPQDPEVVPDGVLPAAVTDVYPVPAATDGDPAAQGGWAVVRSALPLSATPVKGADKPFPTGADALAPAAPPLPEALPLLPKGGAVSAQAGDPSRPRAEANSGRPFLLADGAPDPVKPAVRPRPPGPPPGSVGTELQEYAVLGPPVTTPTARPGVAVAQVTADQASQGANPLLPDGPVDPVKRPVDKRLGESPVRRPPVAAPAVQIGGPDTGTVIARERVVLPSVPLVGDGGAPAVDKPTQGDAMPADGPLQIPLPGSAAVPRAQPSDPFAVPVAASELRVRALSLPGDDVVLPPVAPEAPAVARAPAVPVPAVVAGPAPQSKAATAVREAVARMAVAPSAAVAGKDMNGSDIALAPTGASLAGAAVTPGKSAALSEAALADIAVGAGVRSAPVAAVAPASPAADAPPLSRSAGGTRVAWASASGPAAAKSGGEGPDGLLRAEPGGPVPPAPSAALSAKAAGSPPDTPTALPTPQPNAPAAAALAMPRPVPAGEERPSLRQRAEDALPTGDRPDTSTDANVPAVAGSGSLLPAPPPDGPQSAAEAAIRQSDGGADAALGFPGGSSRAEGLTLSMPSQGPSAAFTPAQPVLQQVSAALAGPVGPVTELRLSPEELGSVRIEVATEGDKVTMLVAAERQDTLDLLRRHADRLMADLREAGFARLDLSFGSWSGPTGGDRSPDNRLADPGHGQPEGDPAAATIAVAAASSPRSAPAGLYLRI